MKKNKITILLKPGVNGKNFVSTMKFSIKDFKFESMIPMDKEGSVIVGWCNKATRAYIKTLPNVIDVEDAHLMHICLDEDGKEINNV